MRKRKSKAERYRAEQRTVTLLLIVIMALLFIIFSTGKLIIGG